MNIYYLIFVSLVLSFSSCTKEKNVMIQNKSTTIRLNEYNDYLIDTIVFSECEYIPLETNNNSVLYGCNRIFVDGDTLFIWDKRADAIHLFNKSGKHISLIQNKGEGPFQYTKIRDVSIDTDKKLLMLSCDPLKLIIYDYQGNGVHSIKASNDLDELAYHNGYIYCYENLLDTELTVFMYDRNPQPITIGELGGEFSMKGKEENTVYRFGKGQRLTANSGCYLTNLFDNSIYKLTEDSIYKSYSINFDKHTFPLHLLSQNFSEEINIICHENKYICSIAEVVENDDYLYFRTNIGFCIYEKKKKELNGFSSLRNSIIKVGTSEILSTNDDNTLVGILNPVSFSSFIKYKIKQRPKWKEEHPQLMHIYENINEESNPILMMYKFKTK